MTWSSEWSKHPTSPFLKASLIQGQRSQSHHAQNRWTQPYKIFQLSPHEGTAVSCDGHTASPLDLQPHPSQVTSDGLFLSPIAWQLQGFLSGHNFWIFPPLLFPGPGISASFHSEKDCSIYSQLHGPLYIYLRLSCLPDQVVKDKALSSNGWSCSFSHCSEFLPHRFSITLYIFRLPAHSIILSLLSNVIMDAEGPGKILKGVAPLLFLLLLSSLFLQ